MIFVNDKEVKVYNFPNNESYIREKEINASHVTTNNIYLKYESDADFINLFHIKKYLDEKSLGVGYLYVPYFPYSRMDRTEGINLFTLKGITEFINSLNFTKVIIEEPHSDVVTALLNRVKVINRTKMLTDKLISEINFGKSKDIADFVLYPDAGALKRYSKQIKWDNIITCNKNRDFTTGEIKNIELSWNKDISKDKLLRVIIVDDLCSRGGTFLQTSKEIKKSFPNSEIYLVVTHCENTIFQGELLKTNYIKKIYTTDSILIGKHKKINITEVF